MHKDTRCCPPPPAPSPTWPGAVYVRGVVVESLESADLALIDDSICGSLPVRALNLGRRESFGHGAERASHTPVCCSQSCSWDEKKLPAAQAQSDATRADVKLTLGYEWTGHRARMSLTLAVCYNAVSIQIFLLLHPKMTPEKCLSDIYVFSSLLALSLQLTPVHQRPVTQRWAVYLTDYIKVTLVFCCLNVSTLQTTLTHICVSN